MKRRFLVSCEFENLEGGSPETETMWVSFGAVTLVIMTLLKATLVIRLWIYRPYLQCKL